LPAVLGDLLVRGVQRPVGGGVGDVEEERLAGRLLVVVGHEADGVVGDGVGVVVALGLVFGVVGRVDAGVVAGEGVGAEVVAGPGEGAVVAVEAALERPVVFGAVRAGVFGDVPLADGVGPVA